MSIWYSLSLSRFLSLTFIYIKTRLDLYIIPDLSYPGLLLFSFFFIHFFLYILTVSREAKEQAQQADAKSRQGDVEHGRCLIWSPSSRGQHTSTPYAAVKRASRSAEQRGRMWQKRTQGSIFTFSLDSIRCNIKCRKHQHVFHVVFFFFLKVGALKQE